MKAVHGESEQERSYEEPSCGFREEKYSIWTHDQNHFRREDAVQAEPQRQAGSALIEGQDPSEVRPARNQSQPCRLFPCKMLSFLYPLTDIGAVQRKPWGSGLLQSLPGKDCKIVQGSQTGSKMKCWAQGSVWKAQLPWQSQLMKRHVNEGRIYSSFASCAECLPFSEVSGVRDGVLEKHMFSKILVECLCSEVTMRNDYFCW